MAEFHCPRCNSSQAVLGARVIDQGEGSDGQLKVGFYKSPQAVILKGTVFQSVAANICGECGFVELFVQNPQRLYGEYLASRQPDVLDAMEKCLECGEPLGKSDRCQKCGWTYTASQQSSEE